MVFPAVMYGCESWNIKLSTEELMLSNCGTGKDSWESPGQQGDQTSQSWKKAKPNIHWKDWCWSWSSSTLTTRCKEPTHWERPWYWEKLRAAGEGGDRGWYVWMALPTQWTWVWATSGWQWRKEKPGMLQSMGLQRVGHNLATEKYLIRN